MPDPLAAALDRLWQTNGPELRARAERVLSALSSPEAVAGEDVVRDAHVLAGALGTYGRPGSELFTMAEGLLEAGRDGGDPGARAALAEDVRRLLLELG